MPKLKKIAVIGGGAFGTALANLFANNGYQTLLWVREKEVVDNINNYHENHLYLPTAQLNKLLLSTNELVDIIKVKSEVLVWVPPAQFLRRVMKDFSALNPPQIPMLLCSKGIEENSLALMTDIAKEHLPNNPLAVLSGPGFAKEIVRGLPTAMTLAGDTSITKSISGLFEGSNLRVYLSDDMIGTEIGGAVKNVLAIACGIAIGKGLGESARAALITRSLIEMQRLCKALGGNPSTMMGLCGLGDLVLTCGSIESRNMSLGAELGKGEKLENILRSRKAVTEGVATAISVKKLADKHNIEIPICEAVYNILHKNADINNTIEQLFGRPFKQEL